MVLVGLVAFAAVIGLPFVALTTAGARRRGQPWPLALLEGVFFPVAWTAWYVSDEHPYEPSARRMP